MMTAVPDPAAVAPPPADPGNSPPEQWTGGEYRSAELDVLICAAADPHTLDPLTAYLVGGGVDGV